MQHREGNFRGADDLQLYFQCWLPAGAPRAALAIVHGFGEHGGRYNHVVDHLLPRDFAVYALDLRGHGRSPGKRGELTHWDQYVEDVDAFVDVVASEQTGLPLFMLGHSMGGLITATYLWEHQARLTGAVLSAPLLAEANISGMVRQATRLLSRIAPDFSLNSGLDPNSISRNPAEVQRYVTDPLVHSTATARLGSEMLRVMPLAHARAGCITLPVLIYHGEGDMLVPIHGSQMFHAEVGCTDHVFKAYPGGYHELHNDIDRETVLEDLHAWLERHID